MKWFALLLVGFVAVNAEDNDCVDEAPMVCPSIIQRCKMPVFRKFMETYCKKTCGWCGGGGGGHIPTPPPVPVTHHGGGGHAACGVPSYRGSRVIAGQTAKRGAWPWQILLKMNGRPGCGGTLVAPQWVVTASHCVSGHEQNPSTFSVTVGEYNRQYPEGSEVEVGVEQVIVNPGWNPRAMDNDITLLKLSNPVEFNEYVKPACLPSIDPAPGTVCYITGWGKMHHPGQMVPVLQQGALPVVSNDDCQALNGRTIPLRVTRAMICAGSGGATRTSGCHGDSGGPFVCNVGGVWELHGSVSYGSSTCDSSQSYTVFSRTHLFVDWVRQYISQ